MIIPNARVSRVDVLNDFGISFPCKIWKACICFVEFLLIFDRYLTFNIFYLTSIYLLGSTIYFDFSSNIYLVGAFKKLPSWQLYIVNLSYIIILKLSTYELTYSVLNKLQISTKFATTIAFLCVI